MGLGFLDAIFLVFTGFFDTALDFVVTFFLDLEPGLAFDVGLALAAMCHPPENMIDNRSVENGSPLEFPHLPWRGPCNQQKNDKKYILLCKGRFLEFTIPAKIPLAMEIITTHLEADFDGIASMVAASKLYPKALLVLPGGAQSRERAYLAQHPLPLTSITSFPISDISKIILVDADHQDRLGPLEKALQNPSVALHIWDHHPLEHNNPLAKRAEFLKQESVGATITLLVETLQKQSRSWSPEEATLFAIALYEETGHFTYLQTTPRDLEVGARLIETGGNLTVVTDILQRKWTEPQVALFNALLHTTQLLTWGGRK